MIKRRIINQEFNDPMRKFEEKTKEYRVREELSAEKSTLGLAEQYEAELVEI